jgi:4,5:9,10-diseco-3-hydroxy-5,9,17-trioxoandrosta-1(10),2-diene-4-oate hydrolase
VLLESRSWLMDMDEIVSEIEEVKKQQYGEYITVAGIRIRYFVRGSGSPLLLIHGFGEFLETWALNVFPLSKRYKVYAIDLPGHGLSDKPKIPYTYAFASEFATKIMETLEIKRASLIGHSLGGAVSVSIAVNFPGKVDKLVLVDCAGLSPRLPLLYRLVSVPGLGDVLMKPVTKNFVKHGVKQLFYNYNPELLSEEVLDMVLTHSNQPGAKKAMISIIRSNVSLDGVRPNALLTDKLHLVKAPTLFIHGAQDRLFPVRQVRRAFRMVPNARVMVVDECGHCPHIEKATQFNESVMAFLEAG